MTVALFFVILSTLFVNVNIGFSSPSGGGAAGAGLAGPGWLTCDPDTEVYDEASLSCVLKPAEPQRDPCEVDPNSPVCPPTSLPEAPQTSCPAGQLLQSGLCVPKELETAEQQPGAFQPEQSQIEEQKQGSSGEED